MTERIASGEEAVKALWDQAVTDNLYLGEFDRLDGVGTRTIVRTNETPRLQILADVPPPVSAAEIARTAQAKAATHSMRYGQQPPVSVGGAVILVVGMLVTLGLLIAAMVGAA